ncbi:MAG: response regulator transcription factor [Burkholderiales bacterium]|nr:response regulator transcription factor [Anaerolineae bacterium]
MLRTLLVEDNVRLQAALKAGLEATGDVQITGAATNGADALELSLAHGAPDVVLMDVALEGSVNGIETAVALRREFPRLPVVFYSIQDDDAYYRAFRQAGILSHYAYVKKSNYLLPDMIVPLLRDAATGRSFVDPDIEARVQAVRHQDENDPMNLLEPNEQTVVRMLAHGLTNEQIASRLGFRDKRTISRTNGEIYAAWSLADNATDEKTARARAAIIALTRRLIVWDTDGVARVLNERGLWEEWSQP